METTENQSDGEEKRLKAVDTSLTATTSKIIHIDATVEIDIMTDTIPTVIKSLPTDTIPIQIFVPTIDMTHTTTMMYINILLMSIIHIEIIQ